jgi:ornithine cyclodeaminase/alanine dehydrogenase-like protein (mu-crystallin family)
MTDWVHAVERAYVAAATGGAVPARAPTSARARAAAGAVASHYLAVGTPRSIGLVGGDDAAQSLLAHRTWFAPRDIRCTSGSLAAAIGGRIVPLAEALTADIVCIHVPLALAAAQLRRGTHVNVLAPVELDDELRKLATIVDEPKGLPALAAGHVDGRQLDELTVFIAGDAAIAAAALALVSA